MHQALFCVVKDRTRCTWTDCCDTRDFIMISRGLGTWKEDAARYACCHLYTKSSHVTFCSQPSSLSLVSMSPAVAVDGLSSLQLTQKKFEDDRARSLRFAGVMVGKKHAFEFPFEAGPYSFWAPNLSSLSCRLHHHRTALAQAKPAVALSVGMPCVSGN